MAVAELLQLVDDGEQIVGDDAPDVEELEPEVDVELAIAVVGGHEIRLGLGDVLARDLVDVADVERAIVGEVEVDLAIGTAVGGELGFYS